jgi:phospholipid/cholesterol/gamma-HCH transport system substrate-binding protein
MSEQTMRFRMGIFVLATMVLLAVLITLFGSAPTLFTRFNRYTVVFADAPGVAQGTPVRRSGVRIGQVEKLYLDSETGQVRVVLMIEKKYPLYEGDEAVLVSGLLAGDTSIDIVRAPEAGSPAEESEQEPEAGPGPRRRELQPGAELKGVPPTGTRELLPETRQVLNDIRRSLQRFDKLTPVMDETLREYRALARETRTTVIPDVRRASEEIQAASRTFGRLSERLDVLVQTNQDKAIKALDALNEDLVRLGNVLNEENQRNLSGTLKNLRTASDTFPGMSKNADELIKEGQQTLRRFNESLNRTDEVLTNLQQVSKPWAQRSDAITRNLDESAVKLNQTLTEGRETLRGLSRPDGTLGRLAADPTLYNNLNETVCGINHLLPRLDRILHDLEVFADKVARHPESLGVGGAISPSSGLKEAPTSGSHLPLWQPR